jgi:hypothetical protein
MARFRTLIGLGLASTALLTAPVFAATTATARPAAHAQLHQAAAATPKAKASASTAAPAKTHLAKATQSNGKKVTYNCNLAGNKNKQACKG